MRVPNCPSPPGPRPVEGDRSATGEARSVLPLVANTSPPSAEQPTAPAIGVQATARPRTDEVAPRAVPLRLTGPGIVTRQDQGDCSTTMAARIEAESALRADTVQRSQRAPALAVRGRDALTTEIATARGPDVLAATTPPGRQWCP